MLKYGILCYVLTFMVGLHDSLINVICFRVLGHEFTNSSEPFGTFHIMQGASAIIFMLIQSKLDTTDKWQFWYYTIGQQALGILSLLILLRFPFKENHIKTRESLISEHKSSLAVLAQPKDQENSHDFNNRIGTGTTSSARQSFD